MFIKASHLYTSIHPQENTTNITTDNLPCTRRTFYINLTFIQVVRNTPLGDATFDRVLGAN